jgi:hypothetical protein
MAFDVLRVRSRGKWPHIPALVVTADPAQREPMRERILDEAFRTFRKTDPVLPLPNNRALILLPLCRSNQVSGTAHRLTRSSHHLSVRKRLVSCDELVGMMPVQWNRGVEVIDKVQRFDGTTVTERRSAMHAASGVGLDEQADPRLMSALEA